MIKLPYILLFSIATLAGIYFSVKNPITHAHFYVVVDGAKANLISISPQGDKIGINPENKGNNQTSFFWGSSKNQLRNIAYFIINTDVDKLEKITIYHEKDRLLASYSRNEFLAQWTKTEQGYKVPSDIIIKRSLLPKINQVINWRGDLYVIPVMLLIYSVTTIISASIYYLFRKENDFITNINYLKLFIVKNKKLLSREFLSSYLLITLAFIGLVFLNQPFNDDWYRMPNDNNGWLQDGRYIMHFAYQLLTVNINRAIAVATPYTYFLSTAFLALANLILARYFNRKNIYISLIVSSFIVLLPFYYENILYQLDHIMMAFTLLWTLTIAIFSYKLNYKTSFIVRFLGVLILLFLYQPMLTSYIFMVAFLFSIDLINNKYDFKKHFIKTLVIIASFFMAVIVYKINYNFLFGMDKINYAIEAGSISKNLDIIGRLQELVILLYGQWQASFLGYAIVLILPTFIIIFTKDFLKTQPKLFTIILFSISLMVIILSPSIIHLLSTLSIRYRYISSINLLITMALLYIYNYSKTSYLHKSSIAIIILVFMNSLGMISYLNNTMQNIAKYQIELKTYLKEDLYQYKKAGGNLNTLAISNDLNTVKTLDNPEKKRYLPAIHDILSAGNYFNIQKNMIGFTELTALPKFTSIQLKNLAYNEIIDRRYYTIRYYPILNRTVINFK